MYEAYDIPERMTRGAARELFRRIAGPSEDLSARPVNKPLVLYGAGNLGRMALDYFTFLGIPVEAAVDVNAAGLRDDPFWSGVRLLGPDEAPSNLRRDALMAVCVATSPYVALARQLKGAGWTDVVPFYDVAEAYRHRHPLSNGWFAETITPQDKINIETVLDNWADDLSRAHHLQFLAWRRLRQEWLFAEAPVIADNRYFIPEVLSVLEPCPRVLDVGAHHGEVAERILNVRSRFERIWMVEPDPKNLRCIESWYSGLDSEQAKRIRVHSCAVASSPGRRSFFGGIDYASQLSPEGSEWVDTKTIDQLHVRPSFVKLHLEGAELDALMGGLDTLRKNRPIIASTSYHNHLGLWETPLWLINFFKTMSPDYRFYFRLHNWCGTGAVVYGVPGERKPHDTCGSTQ